MTTLKSLQGNFEMKRYGIHTDRFKVLHQLQKAVVSINKKTHS